MVIFYKVIISYKVSKKGFFIYKLCTITQSQVYCITFLTVILQFHSLYILKQRPIHEFSYKEAVATNE